VNERERTVPRQALRLLQDGLIEPWGLKAILARDYALCGPRWWALTLGEMMDHRMEERIRNVEADLLLIAGEKDPTSPPSWSRLLEHAAPHARTAVIKGAPHSLMYRDAHEVARLLLEHAGAPVR
jgi:pimeloyl-ACP methyl ester carboxylesterase